MGLLDCLNHFPRQLARKRNVFDQNGEATLKGLLNYGKDRKAKGGVIYGRMGYQDKLIATTEEKKSSYQGSRGPGDASVEVNRVSDPINKKVDDIGAAFPHDHKVQEAVALFKSSRNGYEQLMDVPPLYKALAVLYPYWEKLKEARAAGVAPKAVRFAKQVSEMAPRQPRKRALVRQKTSARARKPVTSAPASNAANTVSANVKVAEPKLDIRAEVAAIPKKFARSDLQDAQQLIQTLLSNPEQFEDPLRLLLIFAQQHAAARSNPIANAWDLNGVTGIDEGLKVLLNTPVLPLLKAQAPALFEAICCDYDALK